MTFLDLDLDFFQLDVTHRRWNTRPPSSDLPPWPTNEVREFLENRCLLSRDKKTPGRFIQMHHQAFWLWRELISSGRLSAPFDVVHIDGHADLGLGDSGYIYLLREVMHRPVDQRQFLDEGEDKLNEGNYLPFAVANCWLRSLTYVPTEDNPGDLMPMVFRQHDLNTNLIQLKPGRRVVNGKPGDFPPEDPVPFQLINRSEYKAESPFDFMLLCHSPQYSSEATDALIPIIREYMEDI